MSSNEVELTRRQLEVLAASAGWLYTSLVQPDSRLAQVDDIACTKLKNELEELLRLFEACGYADDIVFAGDPCKPD